MRVHAHDDEVALLRRELDQVRDELARVRTPAALEPVAESSRYPKAPEPTMYDVEDWVHSFVQGTLERRASNSRRWCAQWYRHPEAVARLRVLYHSYREVERIGDALLMSAWYLEHLDRHLEVLSSADGPFAACSIERHTTHRGLIVARNPYPEASGWGRRPTRSSYHQPPRAAEVT